MNNPKHVSSFEQLPNELFIEVFGYLNGVDTVYVFSRLNTRFQQLVNNYVVAFDFKSVSKVKFDYVTQQQNIHQWQSLRLCDDDDETPGQIKLFCQLFPSFKYISQLQSLSVLNMERKYSQQFLSQYVSLDHLVSLAIGQICGKYIPLIQLPSLKRLVTVSCKDITWMMNLRWLESLEYTVLYECHHGYILTLPTILKRLKIFYREEKDGNALRTTLRQMSQLTKLSLYENGNRSLLPNGQIWEELIHSSLPLLKTFQFYFPFHFDRSTLDITNQIIASFSTLFYLSEKRWFVRCDSRGGAGPRGVLYSLPFAFSHMSADVRSFDTSVSTISASDSDQIESNSYSKLKTSVLIEICQIPEPGFSTSLIEQLVINHSVTTNWLLLSTKLHHLEIGNYIKMSSTHFACLLSNTPQLRSLTISSRKLIQLTDGFRNITICDQLSQRIRSLVMSSDLFDESSLDFVSVPMLSSIARVFGQRCEHLSLALKAHSRTLLRILQIMQQLRSLHISCGHGTDTSIHFSIAWLENSLMDKVSYFTSNSDASHFYIWFGNRL